MMSSLQCALLVTKNSFLKKQGQDRELQEEDGCYAVPCYANTNHTETNSRNDVLKVRDVLVEIELCPVSDCLHLADSSGSSLKHVLKMLHAILSNTGEGRYRRTYR